MRRIPVVLCSVLAVANAEAAAKDSTITKVVKLLQDMLEKSKAEGKEERNLYSKFKCYCDDNEYEKKEAIAESTKSIGVLGSKIEQLQGSTGQLSSECAKLTASIAANEAARLEAQSIRDKEHEAWSASNTDMKAAVSQMNDAIDALAEVGADQTLESAGDNKQFLAGKGKSLATLKATVRQALVAASSFVSPKQRTTVTAFLQAPFTGTYTSQSGQIVGILKSMRDTFKSNLAGAESAEKQQLEAHGKFMDTKVKEHEELTDVYDDKQEKLGSNDDDLSGKKEQLTAEIDQRASDEDFLEKLMTICEEKAKDYAQRKSARVNEDAAIAEAVSILNSDQAFASFQKVDATNTGATGPGTKFIQLRSVQLHKPEHNLVQKVQHLLSKTTSVRAKKIAAMVTAGNPFIEVLKQIELMLKVNVNEGQADKENLDWCNSERTTNDETHLAKVTQIDTLEGEIDGLNTTINDPETGLLKQIVQTEQSLSDCIKAQKTQTAERMEANSAYQVDIKNLVAADEILVKAIKVLKRYYDELAAKIEASEFLQHKREDPAPPETYGKFEGQSEKGTNAIDMLEFILTSTRSEEQEAHSDEEVAQHGYEDSMTSLKGEEADTEKNLVTLQQTLADKQEEELNKKQELKGTKADKVAVEKYLVSIKPGCDFITENFDTREANRETEKVALEKVDGLIRATAVYKTAVAEAHVESFGDCKKPCVEDEEHVKCKACVADTTVPGYCAGHKLTPGCESLP